MRVGPIRTVPAHAAAPIWAGMLWAQVSRRRSSVRVPGSFFDDYCNWQCIPEFGRVVLESPAARIAAAAMRSETAQFFHDHVLDSHELKSVPADGVHVVSAHHETGCVLGS